MRILMIVKKELANEIIVENRSDLVDHLFYVALDIWEMDGQSKNLVRQTRVVNIYNN